MIMASSPMVKGSSSVFASYSCCISVLMYRIRAVSQRRRIGSMMSVNSESASELSQAVAFNFILGSSLTSPRSLSYQPGETLGDSETLG